VFRPRVIPCLLLKGAGLVKTVRFKQPKYVGDPINAVKIFNDKEVDELILLDITATADRREPAYDRVADIASECFMPMCYGGGVRTVSHAQRLLALGLEKIALNTAAAETPDLITDLANAAGSQSVVVAVDVKRDWLGRARVFTRAGSANTGRTPVEYVREAVARGAGEILINSIDRDGTMSGLDLELIREVSSCCGVPVIACGGAATVADLAAGIDAGASAVAAGSMFVFTGRHRAVLINYPSSAELSQAFAPLPVQ
jgi:cyclase